MKYVIAVYKLDQQELAYRVYVTDSLYYFADNKRLKDRYIEMVNPRPVDKRTGDEIALDVITKLGLKTNEFI